MDIPKVCVQCRDQFQISSEDIDFYSRIAVPHPTRCPECRLARRLCFRNERTLYKRKCNAPHHTEDIISVYAPEKNFVVYDEKEWWSDSWSPTDYGQEYDFSKPFFIQYKELLSRVPLIGLSTTNMVNCSYCNVAEGDKDCYLISGSLHNENTMYANRVVETKDSLDMYISQRNEKSYECVSCAQSFNLLFSVNSHSCMNSAFLYGCSNCEYCFGCVNLRNAQYHIFNIPYSKEEYFEKIKEFDLGDYSILEKVKKTHGELIVKQIHKFAHLLRATNVTGHNIDGGNNCVHCFDVFGTQGAENLHYCNWIGYGAKDVWDGGPGVGVATELMYECFDSGIQGSRMKFCGVVYGSYDISYAINCHGSHDLFGCYGIRNKEYCILNKQYTKEEYDALIPKIIAHMNDMPYIDAKGRLHRYGEFFPAEISPFAYNESIAEDYFPISKNDVGERGSYWRENDTRNYEITMKADAIPTHIRDVPDSILGEIIACAHKDTCTHQCASAFRITEKELKFYKSMNIPLPRLCFSCRHSERLAKRNPLKLWKRKCQCGGKRSENDVYENTSVHSHGRTHCEKEFETSYAPERPEIIYCDECFQKEIL